MKPTSWWAASCRASAWMIASLIGIPSSARDPQVRGECLLLLVPRVELLGRLRKEPAAHARVAEPAQLRARDLELPRPGGVEPRRDLVPGNQVLLEAEARDEEAVDDVPGAER